MEEQHLQADHGGVCEDDDREQRGRIPPEGTSFADGIYVPSEDEAQPREPDYLRQTPVPIDLLVDTHCRPMIERSTRAQKLLHTVAKCLHYSGGMSALHIKQALEGVTQLWSAYDSGHGDIEGKKIKRSTSIVSE